MAMNGVEMLVNALIRAMGLNKADLENQAREAWDVYQGFGRDMKAIAATQAALLARFEALETNLQAWRRESPALRDLTLPDDALVERINEMERPHG